MRKLTNTQLFIVLLGAVATFATMATVKFHNLLLQQRIRNDAAGRGHFGAPRGNRTHQGLDLVVQPGEPVFSPIEGRFVRVAYPYANDPLYTGVVLQGEGRMVKVFYVRPLATLRPGQVVQRGQLIGHGQDIAAKYGPPMIPHIHVEVRQTVGSALLDPETLINIT